MRLKRISATLRLTLARCAVAATAFTVHAANAAQSFGQISQNLGTQFGQGVTALVGGMFLVGLWLAGSGVMKLKAHNQDPRGTPITTPLIYIGAGALLLALPLVLGTSITSIFGSTSGILQQNSSTITIQ